MSGVKVSKTLRIGAAGERPVTSRVNPVTGGVEIFGPSGDPLIVIADSAPDDDDGRADGVIYIQTEA